MRFIILEQISQCVGHLPQDSEGVLVKGKVGDSVSVEDAYSAARLTGVNICATLKYALGDLDKVKKIVKLVGFVNCSGAVQSITHLDSYSFFFLLMPFHHVFCL